MRFFASILMCCKGINQRESAIRIKAMQKSMESLLVQTPVLTKRFLLGVLALVMATPYPPARQAGKALTVRLADPHMFAAAPIHWQGEVHGGITRPCDFRPTHRSAVIPDGATPDGRL